MKDVAIELLRMAADLISEQMFKITFHVTPRKP